jgi:hypothetical protein
VLQFSIAPASGGVSLVEVEDAPEPFAAADGADGGGLIASRERDDVGQALGVALGMLVLQELAHDGTGAIEEASTRYMTLVPKSLLVVTDTVTIFESEWLMRRPAETVARLVELRGSPIIPK